MQRVELSFKENVKNALWDAIIYTGLFFMCLVCVIIIGVFYHGEQTWFVGFISGIALIVFLGVAVIEWRAYVLKKEAYLNFLEKEQKKEEDEENE